jgi:hypothetical protein
MGMWLGNVKMRKKKRAAETNNICGLEGPEAERYVLEIFFRTSM